MNQPAPVMLNMPSKAMRAPATAAVASAKAALLESGRGVDAAQREAVASLANAAKSWGMVGGLASVVVLGLTLARAGRSKRGKAGAGDGDRAGGSRSGIGLGGIARKALIKGVVWAVKSGVAAAAARRR